MASTSGFATTATIGTHYTLGRVTEVVGRAVENARLIISRVDILAVTRCTGAA